MTGAGDGNRTHVRGWETLPQGPRQKRSKPPRFFRSPSNGCPAGLLCFRLASFSNEIESKFQCPIDFGLFSSTEGTHVMG